jgi:hypothetical protein
MRIKDVLNKLDYRNKLSLRDYVKQLPSTRKELSDYVLKHNEQVREMVEKDGQCKSVLDEAVNSTFDKYSKYMRGISDKISKLGHGIGYTADAWLLSTGDIVGTMGGKFWNILAQLPEKAHAIIYGVRTGNYLDSLQNVLEGAVSYLPLLTFVDQGLTRIVQKRMVTDALTQFEKATGIYKPWTTRLAEKLKGAYTGVKDRISNVFRPDYEPALQPA